MTSRKINMAASIRQRLLNRAREQREDFGLLLTRYGTERLLYRLGESEYGAAFILKGAMLFPLWGMDEHRPTRDADLLGFGREHGGTSGGGLSGGLPGPPRRKSLRGDLANGWALESVKVFLEHASWKSLGFVG